MTRYALGRQPADPTKPKLRLRRSAAGPTPPESCDWLSQVDRWGMLANDQVGDCTMAGAAHVAMAVDRYGQGRELAITDDQVIAAYAAVSGYNPADPNTDVGATLQDALDYWRKVGIGDGNRIAAAAQLDAQDLDLVRACIATFGAVYCGMSVPASAMDQLDRGQPWTLVERTRNLGGHCIPIGAYTPSSFECVTWGQVQPMTVDFYLRYVDEGWVPIDLDWMRANGTSPAGLDVAGLNADYERLTGKPGPFPNVAPVPPPAPSTDPDRDLLAAFGRWQRRHRTADLAAAFERWQTIKGL